MVVAGASAAEAPPGIEHAGPRTDIRYAPDAAALAEELAGADILFWWRAERAWLEAAWPAAADLRWIQSASDGVDGLLFPALVQSDVTVTNARGVFDASIAEWAIGAILAFATGLRRSIVDTEHGRWEDGRTRDRVAGSHLVVVGSGPIGRAAARRAHDLGMAVTLVGRAPRDDPEFGRIEGPEGLHAVLAGADHVLDALPLAPGTQRLFDAAAFAAMKPGAVFYNVGRGGTVDEEALLAAVDGGHLGGAALDVFDREPLPPDSPWWSAPNVVVSPHVCGDVADWEEQVVAVFVDNLGRYVRGEPLHNLVDVAAGFGRG
ncbi:MAG: D-2-hydroxyacid dehydrogenase [Actinomycetota bacterium]